MGARHRPQVRIRPHDNRHHLGSDSLTSHRDIKPSNYFLSECKNPTRWNGLPIAALGDFGNGFDAKDLQWRTTLEQCMGMGTPRYEAPEQATGTIATIPLTSAANVYQVGLIMNQLMTLHAPTHQVTFENQERPFPPIDQRAYPEELRKLAEECVNVLPVNRPSPKGLYMRMRRLATSRPMSPFGTSQVLWGKLILEFDLWRDPRRLTCPRA